MNILETDTVEFELAFRPGNKGPASVPGVIGEDSFVCVLSINADDKRFWKATIEEGYYQCAGVTPDPVTGICNTSGGGNFSGRGQFNEAADAISWATPYSDDDENDFWCTHVGYSNTWSPFECSAIKCPVWRDLDTLDVTNDLSFKAVKAGVSDTMEIQVGRAMLYINESQTGGKFVTPATNPIGPKSIGVWNGAAPLLATALFMKAMFSMVF